MATLRKSGAWPYSANKDTVIELCVSASSYYTYWNKPFGLVKNFPRMMAWLLKTPDAEPTKEIWGTKEQNLTQLEAWLVEESKNMALRAQRKADKKKRSKKDKGKQREV
jgi:hypothetical protein